MGETDARRDLRASRLVVALFCGLTLLLGGTWAATAGTASPDARDDVVSVDCAAPVEVAHTKRRCSRSLFARARTRSHRRIRTRLRPLVQSHVLVRHACISRRGPPTLVDG